MKSLEYITHGTIFEENADKISKEGLKAQEGRATVSGNLFESFSYATDPERLQGSKDEKVPVEGQVGRMLIMNIPESKTVDYATNTDIEIDEESKTISGYVSKYKSGKKQLGIYDQGDALEKKDEIEKVKKEILQIQREKEIYATENGIDLSKIKNLNDLSEAIKYFSIDKKIEILAKAETFEKQMAEKRSLVESWGVAVPKENILMSIVPSPELASKLDELRKKIDNLEKIDIDLLSKEISEIIRGDNKNILSTDLSLNDIVGNLLVSTIESEIFGKIRSISLDIKKSLGYKTYDRYGVEIVDDSNVDIEMLKAKIQKIKDFIEVNDLEIDKDTSDALADIEKIQ